MTFHLSDDIVRGMEPGGIKNVTGVLILVVWLYGTLVLAERRLGYVIMLVGTLLGSFIPPAAAPARVRAVVAQPAPRLAGVSRVGWLAKAYALSG